MIPANIDNDTLIGRRVEISCSYTMLFGKCGEITHIMNDQVQVRLDGEAHATFWNKKELSLLDGETKRTGTGGGCECGSTAVGSPMHSFYCPLYVSWEDMK